MRHGAASSGSSRERDASDTDLSMAGAMRATERDQDWRGINGGGDRDNHDYDRCMTKERREFVGNIGNGNTCIPGPESDGSADPFPYSGSSYEYPQEEQKLTRKRSISPSQWK